MSHRDQTKAARYIQNLDQARCDGNWSEVPELVRKVRKHAPERLCLTLTAEAEHTVTQATRGRPSTASTTTSIASSLEHLIKPLVEAIKGERTHVEDEFQGHVCLAWIYWEIGDYVSAISRLPGRIEQNFAQLDGTGKQSFGWTRVCALKGAYIKGASQSRTGAPAEGLETFASAIPILFSAFNKSGGGVELNAWTELLLAQYCVLSSTSYKQLPSPTLEADAFTAFQSWGEFWARRLAEGGATPGGYVSQLRISRRKIWGEYFVFLSAVLQGEVMEKSAPGTTLSSRSKRYGELQRVEKVYEDLLLKEVQFPRAEQFNEEVEGWVDLVIQNWRVLCGPGWQEQDLGTDGKEVVGRRVLDILYRAATKTFHSTSILRHLFTVHLSLAEFELAFKAFDTYLALVNKGKARVEKSGEAEQGLDDDETVLATASDCIRALCRYGSKQGAEKARQLAQFFEDWLNKNFPHPEVFTNGNGNGHLLENGLATHHTPSVAPKILAKAWKSIGISQAQWARLTFDGALRPDYQLQAVKSFGRALSPEFESTDDTETLYALAIVLAERRELGPAINIVKTALLPPKAESSHRYLGRFTRERMLIPLWHLLALLLSARHEFTTASRACEGAFEQFKDPKNLFGEIDLRGSYHSEHLNRAEAKANGEKPASVNRGVVDEMDDAEKERVIEVKMTQLVLIEVLEGPQVAVNASDELLSLFTRLFGEISQHVDTTRKSMQSGAPPLSSAGTVRSVRGSIFGRSRRSIRKSSGPQETYSITQEKQTMNSRPVTSHTVTSSLTRAPTIQVTNEHGGHQPRKLEKRSGSLSRKKSHKSMRSGSASGSRGRISSVTPSVHDGHVSTTSGAMQNSEELSGGGSVGLAVNSAGEPNASVELGGHALPAAAQGMPQKEPVLNPSLASTTIQDTRLPHVSNSSSTAPVIWFPKDQARRHRLEILIGIWLLVAGFYRRADLFEDAKLAVDEAYKLVERLEADVSKDDSGKISVSDPGWGVGKSVEELWGDVWAERGYLAKAQGQPYVALSDFEAALAHFSDHPSAIVGLSDILLDIYAQDLSPLPPIPSLHLPDHPSLAPLTSTLNSVSLEKHNKSSTSSLPSSNVPHRPAPLGVPRADSISSQPRPPQLHPVSENALEPPHKASSTALLDRLAARDRAHGLLSGLTKLGSGWNYSEAWFALARAYEQGGQPDKAREVLWWCVELEEGKGVRDWSCVHGGGYVL